VHRSGIARPQIELFSIRWGKILKQLDLVAVAFEDGDRDFCARYSSDFACKISRVVGAVRQLETENVAPESERPIEVRDSDPGVIRRNDVIRRVAHENLTGLAGF
jgi:hypothetical protein